MSESWECGDCKWWIEGGGECLLGRDPAKCRHHPARRGDDELVGRILGLDGDDREDALVRFGRATTRVREEHVLDED